MTNHVLLNNIDHQELKILTGRSAALGDAVMSAPTFPFEFRNIQAHYPIFFQKNPSFQTNPGQGAPYQAVAMFGFEKDENLFLTEGGWDAPYLPLAVERQPFLIGFDGMGADAQTVIHIDLDSPRVSAEDGMPMFLDQGGMSPYLKRIASVLDALHQGAAQAEGFVRALDGLGLLEPFSLDVELVDGSRNRLVGFHTINEDKLAALDAATLGQLHQAGYLQAIYMAVASLSHLGDLITRKNARLQAR